MKMRTSGFTKEDAEYEKQLAEQEHNKLAAEEKAKQELEKIIEEKKELHRKKLQEEKLEMLKLKQGIVDDAEVAHEEKAVVEKPKGRKALENFWYHNSMYIIIFLIFFVIAGYLIYNLASKVTPDMNVLVLPESGFSSKLKNFEKYVEKFAVDKNKDGKVKVTAIHIPMELYGENPTADVGYQAKLMGEIKAGKTMLIVSNKKADEQLGPQGILMDLRKIYPDNPNVTEYGFKLEGDKVKKALDWPDMPDGIYIGIRNPENMYEVSPEKAQKRYKESLIILDKMIKDLS